MLIYMLNNIIVNPILNNFIHLYWAIFNDHDDVK